MIQLLEGSKYKLVTIEKLPEIAQVLKNKPVAFSLDLETTGLNPLTGKVVTAQFGTVKHAFILDCRVYYTLSDQEKEAWKLALVGMLKACPVVIGHNLKFDWKWMKHHYGVSLEKTRDTMLQELILHGVGMGKAESMGISVNMEETGERYGFPVSKELQKWSVNLDKPRKFYADGSYCFKVEKKGKLVDSWWKPDHTPYKEGEWTPAIESFIRETTEQWEQPFPEIFLEYCSQDVSVPLLIHSEQLQRLEELELEQVAEIENRCMAPLAQMELDGCYVDLENWKRIVDKKEKDRAALGVELSAELTPLIKVEWDKQYCYESKMLAEWEEAKEKMLVALMKKYPEVQGKMKWGEFKNKGMALYREQNPRPKTPKKIAEEINLGSSDQLQLALSCMGIHVDSTDKEHLEGYKYAYPLVKKLLEWKWLDHFVNAFGYSLLEKIDVDQRIHPTYNQIGAATGRMSCTTPNWQQLPSHEPEETSVRRCVIAAPGNVLLTADLPNIEARILTDVSEDPALLAFFEKGGDLHCTTARLMFNLEASDKELKGDEDAGITPLELKPGLSYRSVAKTINFGLVYGMSPFKLSRTLGVSVEEAKELFNRYFEAYPGVAEWLRVSPQISLERGYSLTLAGRKRFYPGRTEPRFDETCMEWEEFIMRRSLWFRVRGSQERQAKNAPIQGSNADITKVALILLWHKAPSYVRFVACVHDEIVLECPEDKAEAVKKLLQMAMHKACTKYLKRVHIPEIEVSIASYWKK